MTYTIVIPDLIEQVAGEHGVDPDLCQRMLELTENAYQHGTFLTKAERKSYQADLEAMIDQHLEETDRNRSV